MTVIVGEGAYRFRVEEGWAKLPDGWPLREVGSVGVDVRDNVYVFSRSEHPMIVFDREGNFLRSWGEGIFVRPHGIHMGADDTIWCTDDGDHTVRQCTLDGRVLVTIGTAKRGSPYMSGNPFNRCTHTAHSPEGDIYISDGYGNARIHKFSPDGQHLFSWGESGTAPGQFNLPHNIACDADGWVYVADRESHRIQIFDKNGRYETQWNNLHRPSAMYVQPGCKCPVCYVGECGPVLPVNRAAPNLGPRLSVLDHEGRLLARIGGLHAGNAPGQFISPHGLAVDSRGDLYVGEVSITAWPNLYPDVPPPPDLHCLQKFVRVGDYD